MTDGDQVLIDPTAAVELRERATQARERAEQARTDADALLAEARERARVLVADAEAKARTLTVVAKTAGQEADDAEQRATTIDHARALCRHVDAAERYVADLTGEHAAKTERIAALAAKLADLGRQREDATAALATAREAGDVDQVTALWVRMQAIDEVTGTLTGQVDTARARAAAIGEAGWGGELDQGAAEVDRLRQELSDVLDALDPSRPARRTTETVNDYAKTLAAAGMPHDEAVAMAALLVAARTYPEAAAAYFGAGEQPDEPEPRRQELRNTNGQLIAQFNPGA